MDLPSLEASLKRDEELAAKATKGRWHDDLRTALLARVQDCRELIAKFWGVTGEAAGWKARAEIAESPLAEAVRALERAAKWFREYEAGHRAKGQDLLSIEKANRNAARADFCEREAAALSSLQPRMDTP